MAHGYRPGSTRDGAHESHQTRNMQQASERTAHSDALAFAALSQARAILAAHAPRYNPKR